MVPTLHRAFFLEMSMWELGMYVAAGVLIAAGIYGIIREWLAMREYRKWDDECARRWREARGIDSRRL